MTLQFRISNRRTKSYNYVLQKLTMILSILKSEIYKLKIIMVLQIYKFTINLQTIIRSKNPISLEDALNFVLEKFRNFAKLHNSLQKQFA